MALTLAVFARAGRLYRENPILVLPTLLIQGLAFGPPLAGWLARGHGHALQSGSVALLVSLAWLGVYFFAGNFLTAASMGMSAAAWRIDLATLTDGLLAGTRRWWKLAQAVLLFILIAIPLGFAGLVVLDASIPQEARRRAFLTHPPMAVIGAFVVLGLAFWFFTVYLVPAIVIGERSVVDALRRAARLSWRRGRETLALLAPLALVAGLLVLGGKYGAELLAQGPLWMRILYEMLNNLAEVLWGTYTTLAIAGQFLELEGAVQGLHARPLAPRYE
ncbi:MAG: hypothetical protein KGM44_04125 [bacterium]|nr:hypothetical protein [bacterium]